MVAFHFQFANQAGWKCDVCRRAGLEQKRRCGWLGMGEAQGANLVWGRKEAVLTTCPKSYITAESMTLIEEFVVRRRIGGRDSAELTARKVDAFVMLEDLLEAERRDGQQNSTIALQ